MSIASRPRSTGRLEEEVIAAHLRQIQPLGLLPHWKFVRKNLIPRHRGTRAYPNPPLRFLERCDTL